MAVREIAANPDPERQRQARELLPDETAIIELDEKIAVRADMFVALGFKPADAAHVAAAEAQGAQVLLTCDDRLLRVARRSRGLQLRIENPLAWLKEYKNG
jgi:predicted nucleic acid-binding protein